MTKVWGKAGIRCRSQRKGQRWCVGHELFSEHSFRPSCADENGIEGSLVSPVLPGIGGLSTLRRLRFARRRFPQDDNSFPLNGEPLTPDCYPRRL